MIWAVLQILELVFAVIGALAVAFTVFDEVQTYRRRKRTSRF